MANRIWAVSLVLALCSFVALAGLDGVEYVFVSQPHLSQVVYLRVNALTHSVDPTPVPLITTGLQAPMGVAVDQKQHWLYVADPGKKRLFRYSLIKTKQGLSTDGKQHEVLKGASPRWVAVDDVDGSIYCTDGSGLVEKVQEMPTPTAAADDDDDNDDDDDPDEAEPSMKKRVLYAGSEMQFVQVPAGIAAEGKRLYWADRARSHGGRLGVVQSGLEEPHGNHNAGDRLGSLATENVDLFGVCATHDEVFFTGRHKYLFASKKGSKSEPLVVADDFQDPRGCAWDGDGTIYVADQRAGAVWSVPSWQQARSRASTRLANVESPYGIAVLRSRSARLNFLQGQPGHGLAGGPIWGAGNPLQENPTWDDATHANSAEAYGGGKARSSNCRWLFVPVFLSFFCFASTAFKGDNKAAMQGACGACIIPFLAMVYMYYCTDIVYDLLSGAPLESSCLFLCGWAFLQIFVAIIMCGNIQARPKHSIG